MTEPDRVAPFLERLEHLSVDDLGMLALSEPDPVAREALLHRAMTAAAAAGDDRLGELRAAPGRARDQLLAAFARRAYDPTWFGLNWGRSTGRADDRARILAAVEDAAVAEVMTGLLDEEDLAALREPFELAASMTGTAPSASPRIPAGGARGPLAIALVAGWTAGLGVLASAAVAAAAAVVAGRRRRRPDDPDRLTD